MAGISNTDRDAFDCICKGVHDFNDDELLRLHKIAAEVKAIARSASDRQERQMMGRNQLMQLGGWR